MVKAWREIVTIPTYEIGKAEKNPIFLEKRVYQGSSGVVYPYPVVESIANEPTPHEWKVVFLENEYLKAEIDVYRKQLEQLGKRPRFTDGMRRRQAGQASAAFPEPQRLRGALRPYPQERMPGAACPRRGEVPPQGPARVRGALSDGATAPGHRQLPGRAGWKNHGCAP